MHEPKIVAYARVLCSGRVSPEWILRIFREGVDGVLALGCHSCVCHFMNGNHGAAKCVPILKRILEFLGLEPQRLRLEWVSASEGERFAQVVDEFTEAVRRLPRMRQVSNQTSEV